MPHADGPLRRDTHDSPRALQGTGRCACLHGPVHEHDIYII
jgi:hypothetical protein